MHGLMLFFLARAHDPQASLGCKEEVEVPAEIDVCVCVCAYALHAKLAEISSQTQNKITNLKCQGAMDKSE